MNTVSFFVYELLLMCLHRIVAGTNAFTLLPITLLPLYFQTYLFYPEQVIWGRAQNKTTHFRNMLFIRRKQMFILPALCVSHE